MAAFPPRLYSTACCKLGQKKVHGIDKGVTDKLIMRNDPRVVLRERVQLYAISSRELYKDGELADLGSSDVFISF